MMSHLCSVEPPFLEGDLTFQYSLSVHTSVFPDDLTRSRSVVTSLTSWVSNLVLTKIIHLSPSSPKRRQRDSFITAYQPHFKGAMKKQLV